VCRLPLVVVPAVQHSNRVQVAMPPLPGKLVQLNEPPISVDPHDHVIWPTLLNQINPSLYIKLVDVPILPLNPPLSNMLYPYPHDCYENDENSDVAGFMNHDHIHAFEPGACQYLNFWKSYTGEKKIEKIKKLHVVKLRLFEIVNRLARSDRRLAIHCLFCLFHEGGDCQISCPNYLELVSGNKEKARALAEEMDATMSELVGHYGDKLPFDDLFVSLIENQYHKLLYQLVAGKDVRV
jgi:hypothetical protein